MRKIPKAPTEHIDVAIDRMLNEGKELKPKMLLLYENDALMKWDHGCTLKRRNWQACTYFQQV